MIKYRGRRCTIRRRRKYTAIIGGKKKVIRKFKRRVRIWLMRRYRRIKRKRGRWCIRIKRRWRKLRKRGKRFYFRYGGRLKRIKRIRLSCVIGRRRRRVRYRRGKWAIKRKGKGWRGIKRRVVRYFRYGRKLKIVRKTRRGYRVRRRNGKYGKVRRYKTKLIYRRRGRRRKYELGKRLN